jgi:hypothetical protein
MPPPPEILVTQEDDDVEEQEDSEDGERTPMSSDEDYPDQVRIKKFWGFYYVGKIYLGNKSSNGIDGFCGGSFCGRRPP